MNKKSDLDWQGHRGCRGLLPENSIPAFLKAIDFGVNTLELDLAVSKDKQLIVSHEPWFNADICLKNDGSELKKSEGEKLLIYNMTYEEIQQFDCGSKGNVRFPEQQKMKTHKPSFEEMVLAVKSYCQTQHKPMPRLNIEIKSSPEGDNIAHPTPAVFAEIVLDFLKKHALLDQVCIQSFDPRCVQEVRKRDDKVVVALLVENLLGFDENIKTLGFSPNIYSPYYKLVNKKLIKNCHEKGIKVIPWTVNNPSDMEKLVRKGVDGIITDYPDRMLK